MLKKIFDNFNILAHQYGQLQTIEKWECIDTKGEEIPWYTYSAIEYLNSLDFSKKNIFEYGSGNSSLYWAKKSKKVISIENDSKWFSKINNKKLINQEIILVEEGQLYENAIKSFNEVFDVIIIDGKRRTKCSEIIYEYLNKSSEEGCMVILDNSDWYKGTAKYIKDKFDFIEIDFHGFGPINNYTWTTSIFISRNFKFKSRKQVQPLSSLGSIQNNSEELEIIKDYLKNKIKQNENIIIYGFGLLGNNLHNGLKEDYTINEIIDNQLSSEINNNILIKSKENIIYKNEYIIITVLNKSEIKKIVSDLKDTYNISEDKIIICANVIEKYFYKMNCKFKDNIIYELNTYAQDSEDTIIKRIFEYRNLYEGGFFIDVGAHHPIRYSNTFFFYKKGWRGINIDAMPDSMKEFEKIRPEDINIEYAISNEEKILTYYQFDEPAFNSFDRTLSLDRAQNKKHTILNTKKLKTVTLSSILDKFISKEQNIDFLSIDVEGLDFQVLQSNNWEKYRPKVVLIEILNIEIEQILQTEIYKFMIEKEYKYYAKTVGTHFFIENSFFNKRFINFNLCNKDI